MEPIELRILKYVNSKGDGKYAIHPFLELYLMAKYKESKYIGLHLIEKVKEMDKEGTVKISNKGIQITQKGLDLLLKNSQ